MGLTLASIGADGQWQSVALLSHPGLASFLVPGSGATGTAAKARPASALHEIVAPAGTKTTAYSSTVFVHFRETQLRC